MKQTRMFSFVALLALLCIPGLSRAQQTLTVYDGTATSSYVPVYGFYCDAYLKCEFVIPASELTAMSGGTISQMDFYASTPAEEAWTGTFQVFLKEVEADTLIAYSGTTDATIVYTGTLDGTGSIMTVEFDNDYLYNGGNLLVGIYLTTTGNYKSVTFSGQTISYNCCMQGYSYSSLDGVEANQRNFIPKTTFTYRSHPEGVVIGDLNSSETSYAMPVNTYYKYSLNETIIDASEIGGPMTIGSISYKYDYTTPMTSSKYGIKIWLKPTTKTVFSSNTDMEFVDNTATLVYDGPIACSEGWNEITFTTPYSYSGSGNLMVIVRDTVDGFDGDDYMFIVAPCTGNKTFCWMSDSQIPEITTLSAADYKDAINQRPLMILGGSSVDCSGVLDLPFTCGFEPTDNLDCWSFTDADGDGNGWLDNVAMDVAHDTYNFYTPVFHSGTGCYMSDSYNLVPLTPDNWMVTPKLHIPSNGATLEWWDYATYEEDYAEHYSVLVSTTGTEISDFTGNVFETTLTQGETWVQRVVSLADYAGQDVYIAFRHYNCTDQLALAIDDISVTSGTPAPLSAVTISGPTSGAANTVLTFTATGSDDASYFWYADDSFVDNVSNDGHTAEITWLVPGTYKVRVTATRGSQSVSDSLMVTISRRNPETTITSTAQWYGAAIYSEGDHASRFFKFSMQHPEQAQDISEANYGYAYAAEYANGNVYIYDYGTNKLYRQPFDVTNPSINNLTEIGSVSNQIMDMSYNIVDNTMYGIILTDGVGQLASIDLTTGALTTIGTASSAKHQTFAIDATGNAYSIATDGKLYSVNLSDGSFTEIGSTGLNVNYVQSMSFDRATGELFWAQVSDLYDFGLYKVNTTTGHADFIGYIGNYTIEICGLFNTSMLAPNGVNTTDEATTVSLYPNPATDVVTVSAEGLREVSLLDLNGRVLSTTTSPRVDVSGLDAGVYFLRVVTDNGIAREKLVKE